MAEAPEQKPAAEEVAAKTGAEEAQETIEKIEPKAAPREQTLRLGDDEKTYTQRPLNFFGKMKFFACLGGALDKAMTGEGALTLSHLFSAASGPSSLGSPSAFKEADLFVQAIAKLMVYAPNLLKDLYVIWLGIPQGEVPWAIAAMDQPADMGGLSDEDGLAIVETFLDQNGDAIESFFVDKIRPLVERVKNQFAPASASSKPSRATRRATQKGSKSS
jgi:hypothetical protein